MKRLVKGCRVFYLEVERGASYHWEDEKVLFEGEDANWLYFYRVDDDRILALCRRNLVEIESDYKENADEIGTTQRF